MAAEINELQRQLEVAGEALANKAKAVEELQAAISSLEQKIEGAQKHQAVTDSQWARLSRIYNSSTTNKMENIKSSTSSFLKLRASSGYEGTRIKLKDDPTIMMVDRMCYQYSRIFQPHKSTNTVSALTTVCLVQPCLGMNPKNATLMLDWQSGSGKMPGCCH